MIVISDDGFVLFYLCLLFNEVTFIMILTFCMDIYVLFILLLLHFAIYFGLCCLLTNINVFMCPILYVGDLFFVRCCFISPLYFSSLSISSFSCPEKHNYWLVSNYLEISISSMLLVLSAWLFF